MPCHMILMVLDLNISSNFGEAAKNSLSSLLLVYCCVSQPKLREYGILTEYGILGEYSILRCGIMKPSTRGCSSHQGCNNIRGFMPCLSHWSDRMSGCLYRWLRCVLAAWIWDMNTKSSRWLQVPPTLYCFFQLVLS